jgi:hypothetical protein
MNRSIALPEVGPSRAMYLTHNIKRLLVKSGHIKKTDPSGHASLSQRQPTRVTRLAIGQGTYSLFCILIHLLDHCWQVAEV